MKNYNQEIIKTKEIKLEVAVVKYKANFFSLAKVCVFFFVVFAAVYMAYSLLNIAGKVQVFKGIL